MKKNLNSGIAGAILTGVIVLAAPQAANAQRPHLPIKYDDNWRIGEGNWVQVCATFSDGAPARIDGTITVRNFVFLSGFCGSAVLNAHDGKGNIIGRWKLDSCGVNGELFGGSVKSKTFSIDVPAALADRVRSLTVEALYADNPSLGEKIAEGKRLIEELSK